MYWNIFDKERYNLLKNITDTIRNELLPKTYVEYNWDKIKRFFLDFQPKFQKNIEYLLNI